MSSPRTAFVKALLHWKRRPHLRAPAGVGAHGRLPHGAAREGARAGAGRRDRSCRARRPRPTLDRAACDRGAAPDAARRDRAPLPRRSPGRGRSRATLGCAPSTARVHLHRGRAAHRRAAAPRSTTMPLADDELRARLVATARIGRRRRRCATSRRCARARPVGARRRRVVVASSCSPSSSPAASGCSPAPDDDERPPQHRRRPDAHPTDAHPTDAHRAGARRGDADHDDARLPPDVRRSRRRRCDRVPGVRRGPAPPSPSATVPCGSVAARSAAAPCHVGCGTDHPARTVLVGCGRGDDHGCRSYPRAFAFGFGAAVGRGRAPGQRRRLGGEDRSRRRIRSWRRRRSPTPWIVGGDRTPEARRRGRRGVVVVRRPADQVRSADGRGRGERPARRPVLRRGHRGETTPGVWLVGAAGPRRSTPPPWCRARSRPSTRATSRARPIDGATIWLTEAHGGPGADPLIELVAGRHRVRAGDPHRLPTANVAAGRGPGAGSRGSRAPRSRTPTRAYVVEIDPAIGADAPRPRPIGLDAITTCAPRRRPGLASGCSPAADWSGSGRERLRSAWCTTAPGAPRERGRRARDGTARELAHAPGGGERRHRHPTEVDRAESAAAERQVGGAVGACARGAVGPPSTSHPRCSRDGSRRPARPRARRRRRRCGPKRGGDVDDRTHR